MFDKLGRFTPAAAGIDRDEWLFQAGRASVRPPRVWKWTAGLLAATQAATLAVWLAAPASPQPSPPAYAPPIAAQTAPPAPAPPETPDPASYGLLARTLDLDAPPPTFASPRHVGTLTAGSRTDLD